MGRYKTMKATDAITGSSGQGYINIEGENHILLYLINVEAKMVKTKNKIAIMGRKSKGNKANGAELTGKGSIYYVTTLYRRMALEYLKTGKDLYFDMVIENEDEASDTGRQVILLKGVNIDSYIIAKLDAETTELKEEIEFTFEDFEILESFNEVEGEYIN